MANKKIRLIVKPADMRRKLTNLYVTLERLPQYSLEIFRDKILPDMIEDMRSGIASFDTTFGEDWFAENKNFQIVKKKGNSLQLKINAKNSNGDDYANSLISGVSEHGPVYVGDWAERNNLTQFKQSPGTQRNTDWTTGGGFSKFIRVGGVNSRIQKNQSQRDFVNPIVKNYFGKSGFGPKLLADGIYKKLKKQVK